MTLESIEERGLIGVDDPSRTRDLDELDLVDFPRRALRRHPHRGLAGVTVHALLRARVIDEAEVVQLALHIESGFFERLAACGCFECLVGIRCAFRDAPRRAPVVIPRRMYEQHL